MIIVTLARKPLSESTVATNILKHGTGALNVDASRILVRSSDDIHAKNPHTIGGFGHADAAIYGNQGTGTPAYDPTSGRWPANLILNHMPGCRFGGMVRVGSDGHYPSSRPRGSGVSGLTGHKGQEGLQERFLHGEVVESWDCVPRCPVASVDAQSGILTNTSHYSYKRSGGEFINNIPDRPSARHWRTETGGASRFFRVLKS